MALPYSTEVNALTHELANKSSADVIYDSNPLFLWLKEKGQILEDGGARIRLPLSYAKTAAAGAFEGFDLLDVTPTVTENAAVYDWRRYYVHVAISKHDILLNSGRNRIINLVRARMDNGMSKMLDQLGDDLYSTNGDSSLGISGLRQMVEATGQIGNVDQADVATWASAEDNATNTLTLKSIEDLILNASVGSERPDLGSTTKGIYSKLWDLYQGNQRFGAPEESAKGGFRYLMVDFIPIFHDSKVPGTTGADNHLFLLNSKWVYLYVHRGDNFTVQELPMPQNQDVMANRITVTLQLATDNRRMHGKFTVLQP